jgi:hypothetical protein
MDSLDIFQKSSTGVRVWICTVGSMQEARMRLSSLQQADPAEYYACDLSNRRVIAAVTRTQPELHTVADDSELFG